jgi:hypothetical protein
LTVTASATIAPVTLTARVTDADIAEGCPCDPGTCPIARAVHRLLDVGFDPAVTRGKIAVYNAGGYCVAIVPTPPRAVAFMDRFDSTYDGDPFEFPVTLPAACLAPAEVAADA